MSTGLYAAAVDACAQRQLRLDGSHDLRVIPVGSGYAPDRENHALLADLPQAERLAAPVPISPVLLSVAGRRWYAGDASSGAPTAVDTGPTAAQAQGYAIASYSFADGTPIPEPYPPGSPELDPADPAHDPSNPAHYEFYDPEFYRRLVYWDDGKAEVRLRYTDASAATWAPVEQVPAGASPIGVEPLTAALPSGATIAFTQPDGVVVNATLTAPAALGARTVAVGAHAAITIVGTVGVVSKGLGWPMPASPTGLRIVLPTLAQGGMTRIPRQ